MHESLEHAGIKHVVFEIARDSPRMANLAPIAE